MPAKRHIESDSDDEEVVKKPAKRPSLSAAKAKKTNFLESSDEDEGDYKPKKATPAGKSAGKAKREPSVCNFKYNSEVC